MIDKDVAAPGERSAERTSRRVLVCLSDAKPAMVEAGPRSASRERLLRSDLAGERRGEPSTAPSVGQRPSASDLGEVNRPSPHVRVLRSPEAAREGRSLNSGSGPA